jgi:hypothetical protein
VRPRNINNQPAVLPTKNKDKSVLNFNYPTDLCEVDTSRKPLTHQDKKRNKIFGAT